MIKVKSSVTFLKIRKSEKEIAISSSVIFLKVWKPKKEIRMSSNTQKKIKNPGFFPMGQNESRHFVTSISPLSVCLNMFLIEPILATF